jgi:hypothetical protein
MPQRTEVVANCKIKQAFDLAYVAQRNPIEKDEHYRRLETPLIYIFQQLAAQEDMAHMQCSACPGRQGPAEDAGKITVWTMQTREPRPIVDCTSESCEYVLPSTMKTW